MKNNPWDEIHVPSHDIAARRVDHLHPLDIFWARNQLGNYLFYCEFEEGTKIPEKFPNLKGIEVLRPPEGNRLILLLKNNNDWEIFLSICKDIISTTKNIDKSSSVIVILRRLEYWQDFLKKNRPVIMTEDGVKGLIGELLFIKKYLIPAFGAGQAIKFWQGPEGSPQDFNVNNSAIESKCQSGTSIPSVRINSAEQLCSQMPEMYLYVVTLGKTTPGTANSINLNRLVDDIRELLLQEISEQLERFNDLLYMTGYLDGASYSDLSYILSDEKMYGITEGFPRICPDLLPQGIVHLTYSINLLSCKSFEQYPDWIKSIS